MNEWDGMMGIVRKGRVVRYMYLGRCVLRY